MADEKKSFHLQVAEEVIAALKDGTAPWIKPWEPGQQPEGPMNAMTGKSYRGMNRMRLSMAQGGNIDSRWCTYKQAESLGGQVKKGSRGIGVQYWKFDEQQPIKDEQGRPVLGEDGKPKTETLMLERPRAFFATVFHASQIENMPPLPPREESRPEWERHQQAENLLMASNAKIFHDQADRAYYRPSTDEIHLPPRQQFSTPDKYYATALHEVGHWSGHESRLNRDLNGPFGSDEYAREELRAEMASYMLGADLGIGHDPGQHHAYIASWIESLEKDPREIIRAAQAAEQIREYVVGLEKNQELSQGNEIENKEHAKEYILESQEQAVRQESQEKTWLNVPYKEKKQAKAAGAKWDREEKRWFAPEGADLKALGQWLEQDKDPVHQVSSVLHPRAEFGQTLREAGLLLEGDPAMDGKIHRVPVEHGRSGARDGAYCGHEQANRPNGWYQNHKTGEQGKWLATGQVLTQVQKTELSQEVSAQLTEAEKERQAVQEQAQKRAFAKWMNAAPHPMLHTTDNYLDRKGVENLGLRYDKLGTLLVPGYDLETGRIQTLQSINPAGAKWFGKDCPKSGAVYVYPDHLNHPEKEQDKEHPEIVLVAEGYATGASLHQATGLPVAIAFDAGNLKEAAMAIHKKLPKASITICADNDHSHPSGNNVGVDKAKEAAAAVGGKVIVPEFSKEEKEKGLTDFNDLHQSRGLDAVAKAVGHKAYTADQSLDGEVER